VNPIQSSNAGGFDAFIAEISFQSASSTALTSTANPSTVGQSVTFTATVSPVSPGTGTPTGTVTFKDGATVLGTTNLAAGQASFTTSALSVGGHAITASYSGDGSFSASSASLTQNVGYALCLLYDATKSVKSGAVYPIKLQLCDANGVNLSSSSFTLHATQVTSVSGFSGDPESPGNANPDNDFRFDTTLGPGYIFNFSTKGLATGTYSLNFTVTGDPTSHSATFGVK
jgi:hypothetical protein